MDDLTTNRARELIAAGRSQRTAALELGVSRASIRRAVGAAGVDARADGHVPSSNGALHREAPAPTLTVVTDLDGDIDAKDDDLEGEDDTAELPDRTAMFAAVLVAVAILAVFLWPYVADWREGRAAGRSTA